MKTIRKLVLLACVFIIYSACSDELLSPEKGRVEPPSLVQFDINFERRGESDIARKELLKTVVRQAEKKKNLPEKVFVFYLETVSDEYLSEKTTPHLWKFLNENVTPKGISATTASRHSTYSIFTGDSPDHLDYAIDQRQNNSIYYGSLMLNMFEQLGYRIYYVSTDHECLFRKERNPSFKGYLEVLFGREMELIYPCQTRDPKRITSSYRKVNAKSYEYIKESKKDNSLYIIRWLHAHNPYQIDRTDARSSRVAPPPGEATETFYKQAINVIDQYFGLMIEEIKNKGWYDNSLIVVFGDHGESMGFKKVSPSTKFPDEENITKTGMVIKHGADLLREQIDVPISFRFPKNLNIKNRKFASEISHLDMIPTLFDAFGYTYEHKALRGFSIFDEKVSHRQRSFLVFRPEVAPTPLYVFALINQDKKAIVRFNLECEDFLKCQKLELLSLTDLDDQPLKDPILDNLSAETARKFLIEEFAEGLGQIFDMPGISNSR